MHAFHRGSALLVGALAGLGVLFAASGAGAKPKLNPIIFVHGASGSGAQFESQAMRFTSNGYPSRYMARYVNLDGAESAAPPGGVPTLALWAGAAPPIGEIVGATNVTRADQEHT
jgi:pimeloyl-ACP methyl ester carboxylesterase